ncbi:SRPBCC domain-containing protein [Gracilibacillus caseinilyticus]|uniref:SRPBCC domain-containing protein n=1 Tax=Gracilibacillus caseinilyticus TaxID=2932256 RepID=A0ABY4EYE0_9BACI|nr:SRPBCC domain-containing protein [Gracilibacillus caseinilyticus]UOQ48912.1 SRPBCC domain-containing protein [Gracilibacillus caseinilyticus]
MSSQSTVTLTMAKAFNVQAEKVFEAWITPSLMKKWLFTMEMTNKVAKSEAKIGGEWEIVDHREGKDYRAIGEYRVLDAPNKIVKTFRMPQFSDTEDVITITIESTNSGSNMTFIQKIIVPHEENWTEEDIDKTCREYHDSTKAGWEMMFAGLKQLVETGNIQYPEF